MELSRFSMGVGDRFGLQGKAQLQAFIKARSYGLEVTPVWNKSFREHSIVKTNPIQVREEADNATTALNWDSAYFVDADHINNSNVDYFLSASDFFTIDIADTINKSSLGEEIDDFIAFLDPVLRQDSISVDLPDFKLNRNVIGEFAEKYLAAAEESRQVYLYLVDKLGGNNFITEVSLDEASEPQTPLEIFLFLAALGQKKIDVRTIAPRFSGAFNKGIDYEGDLTLFAKEFEAGLKVIQLAVNQFGLSSALKMSIHSGSDKFSIYSIMRDLIYQYNTGLHLKTAGTTWLEELIGLALAGSEGLEIAKEIFRGSLERRAELCSPYLTVLNIDNSNLPSADQVDQWSGERFAETLRHDQDCSSYNSDFRQLLHVGYKLAAEMGDRYLSALNQHALIIGEQVEQNILERHMKRVFLKKDG